ncbi:SMI1/KNR4 family protein [Thioclava litoralis]|uniref:SMI1/KNR4 family protein n=1 Tax=Thioclava litoralis TaxID=3076557 RepID=A0ABZ1E1L4_9RHOB|nr:SMI1/KNR4 family protein [Thioclava sp. FTW29]
MTLPSAVASLVFVRDSDETNAVLFADQTGLPADALDALRAVVPLAAQSLGFTKEVCVKAISLPPRVAGPNGPQIASIFGLGNRESSVFSEYNRMLGRLPKQVVPIADDGLGNLFVVSKQNGQVYFWDHECPDEEASEAAFTLIASSADDFLSRFVPAPSINSEELKRGVRSVRLDFLN